MLDTSPENLPDSDAWNTDVTFIKTPPIGSVLMARMLPPGGGDTSWSSNVTAHNALSQPFRRFLHGLTAVHVSTHDFTKEQHAGGDQAKWNEAVKNNPPVVHPVTGKLGLFINSIWTTRIVELSKSESDMVLRYLFTHCAKPEFTGRWKWSVGDVAFWDTRLTQHYALADYLPRRRIMHRATILGDELGGP
ncbi:hypothetical protein RvY_11574 [Ramazzottius varieornatus]|uniref:TauD/TfdA-like domain-containing protein n=1 Tax=Ramazzottius varieornatus TaxID=947166 RepID=A0A1D1VKW7_RAMVA|nr:hypothetical protein RvY_11574 [Ramazzottius varieornatus]